MGRKRVAPGPNEKSDSNLFCYFCDRTFEDITVLIQHQRDRHFRCGECGFDQIRGKCESVQGLIIHYLKVHSKTLQRVPNAIEGRDSPSIHVYGMDGIPSEILEAKGVAPRPASPERVPRPQPPAPSSFPGLPPGLGLAGLPGLALPGLPGLPGLGLRLPGLALAPSLPPGLQSLLGVQAPAPAGVPLAASLPPGLLGLPPHLLAQLGLLRPLSVAPGLPPGTVPGLAGLQAALAQLPPGVSIPGLAATVPASGVLPGFAPGTTPGLAPEPLALPPTAPLEGVAEDESVEEKRAKLMRYGGAQ